MAAPAFVAASAGTTDASGGWTHTGPAPGAAGRLYVVHVLQDGTNAGVPAITSVTNAENLSGVDNVLTKVGQFDVGNPAAARHHVWVGRSLNTSAMVITGSNTGGDDVYVRVYVFSGVSASTSLTKVIENGSPGATVVATGTSDTAADADVTTLGPERLVVNLLAINDDNPVGAFSGQTGGTWAETVAEYATASGTDGCIQIQTATMNTAGTIGGGSASITDPDAWGVVGFALLPTGPAVYSGAVVTPITSNRVTNAVRRTFSQVANAVSLSATTAGILPTRGTVTWANFQNPLPVSIKGAASSVSSLGMVTNGRATSSQGISSFVVSFVAVTSPPADDEYGGEAFGSGQYGDATPAAVSLPIGVGITTAGSPLNPQNITGSSSFTVTAAAVTNGIRKVLGAVAAPETVTVETIGQLDYEVQTLGLVVDYDALSRATVGAMGAVSLPVTTNIVTRSTTGGTVAGNVVAPTSFATTTSGVVTAMAQTQFKFSWINAIESTHTRLGRSTTTTTAAIQTGARLTARSRVDLPVAFNITAGRTTLLGAVAANFTFNTRTMRATYNPPRAGYIRFPRKGIVRKGHQVELV